MESSIVQEVIDLLSSEEKDKIESGLRLAEKNQLDLEKIRKEVESIFQNYHCPYIIKEPLSKESYPENSYPVKIKKDYNRLYKEHFFTENETLQNEISDFKIITKDKIYSLAEVLVEYPGLVKWLSWTENHQWHFKFYYFTFPLHKEGNEINSDEKFITWACKHVEKGWKLLAETSSLIDLAAAMYKEKCEAIAFEYDECDQELLTEFESHDDENITPYGDPRPLGKLFKKLYEQVGEGYKVALFIL